MYIYTLHLFIDWYTFMCDGCRRRSKSDIQLPFIPIDANTVPRFFFVFYSGVLLFFFNAFSTALIAKYMRWQHYSFRVYARAEWRKALEVYLYICNNATSSSVARSTSRMCGKYRLLDRSRKLRFLIRTNLFLLLLLYFARFFFMDEKRNEARCWTLMSRPAIKAEKLAQS